MRNSNGFTVIEITVTVLIIGILSAVTVMKFSDNLVHQELDQTANTLYLELRGLRSLAFKHDSRVVAKFSGESTSHCEIYVDKNDNEVKDDGEVVQRITLPQTVLFGLSEQAPDAMPYPSAENENWSPPENGFALDWEDSLVVAPDSRGAYTLGGVCLYSPKIASVTYFIGIAGSMESMEIYKWEGTSWRKR